MSPVKSATLAIYKMPLQKTQDTIINKNSAHKNDDALAAIVVDTVQPLMKTNASADAAAALLYKIVADTVERYFTSFSTNSNSDDNGSNLLIVAKTKDGKSYRLKKVNDVVTEFSINDVAVPQLEYQLHKEEISQLENTYQQKMVRSKLRRLADNQERRNIMDKQRLMMDMKRENMQKRVDDRKIERVSEDIKKEAFKTIIDRQQKTLADQKNRVMRDTLDKFLFNKKTALFLQKSADSLLHQRLFNKDREAFQQKQAWIKERQSEDDIHIHEAATQMKNIAADLEREGIKVDMAKSWFALDKDQFIVDGKKMTPELHEKFLAKYVKPRDGWGYYYGPIQVRGRGVFLDYRDVMK